jgi:ABC-type phosphate transport system auxiliary subunit
MELTTQNLRNTQEKLAKAEELARINNEHATSEINSLNKQLEKERANFREQLESTLNDKAKEIDSLRKLHQT